MWIDYAVRQGITATGAFVRLPVLLSAARTSGNGFPEEGDTVIFSKYGGTEVKYDGQEYLLLNARDILAVVEK